VKHLSKPIPDGLAAWCREQTDAHMVMRKIAQIDRRLVIWCACACAETAAPFVPTGEESVATAIRAARGWVARSATLKLVRQVSRRVRKAASGAGSHALASAALSAWKACFLVYAPDIAAPGAAADVVFYVADATSFSQDPGQSDPAASASSARFEQTYRSLCGVIADAVATLPAERIKKENS